MSKPTVKQRPKPPPYPRPVPHFVVDELPPRPEDIAWSATNGGGHYSDGEDTTRDVAELEERAAKRRRIEACATAYLRGEPLYIMSAQLKGPFKDGWKNPWARKRKPQRPSGGIVKQALEIPETSRKIPSTTNEAGIVRPRNATPDPHPFPRSNARLGWQHNPDRPEQAPSPFTSRVQKPPGVIPKLPQEAKERRVEEWLRVNDTFAKKGDILVQSSPTPMARKRQPSKQSPDRKHELPASQSEPPRALPTRRSPRQITDGLLPEDESKLLQAHRRIQSLSRDIQTVMAEPLAKPSDQLQNEVRQLAGITANSSGGLDPSRAEYAIIKSRRGGLQTAPADAHMSPFEFRTAFGKDDGETNVQALSLARKERETSKIDIANDIAKDVNQQQEASMLDNTKGPSLTDRPIDERGRGAVDDVHAAAPQPQTGLHLIQVHDLNTDINVNSEGLTEEPKKQTPTSYVGKPMLATAVSEISTTDMLPSAQPPIEPQLSVSSIPHEKMLSIKPTVSISERTDGANEDESNCARIDERLIEDTENVQKPANVINVTEKAQENVIFGDKMSAALSDYNVAEINTQEMLNKIEPLELSTVKKSKPQNRDSATPTVNTKQGSKRKKTSFVADSGSMSSHSSIKDAMKARVSKQLASPPLFMFSKEDLDIEVSEDENESPRKRSRPVSGVIKPKSILKSTNPTSSPNSSKKPKSALSTGQGQDGQQRNPIDAENGVEGDGFDLDAAIDDLGSFLGTWDAEREASSLDIEL